MPPSCALLGGFAIGAWVALLWQHYGNAWQSPAVNRQAHRTHAAHAHYACWQRLPSPVITSTHLLCAPFHFVHTARCCNANAKCYRVHACTRSMPSLKMWTPQIRCLLTIVHVYKWYLLNLLMSELRVSWSGLPWVLARLKCYRRSETSGQTEDMHNKKNNIGSRPSDHYFRSVCWFVCLSVCLSVCLFVQSFSQPSLIRFRSK